MIVIEIDTSRRKIRGDVRDRVTVIRGYGGPQGDRDERVELEFRQSGDGAGQTAFTVVTSPEPARALGRILAGI